MLSKPQEFNGDDILKNGHELIVFYNVLLKQKRLSEGSTPAVRQPAEMSTRVAGQIYGAFLHPMSGVMIIYQQCPDCQ